MDKVAVPKFGSFKSKQTTKEIATEAPPDSGSEHRHKSSHCDQPKRQGHRHRQRHHSRDRLDRHENRDDRSAIDHHHDHSPNLERPIVRDDAEKSELFIVDRRGDAKNVEYGSLHRYAVPHYYRAGEGTILGIPTLLKIDRDLSSAQEIVLTSPHARRKQQRLLTSRKGRSQEHRLRYVLYPSDGLTDSTESDYIELRSSRKRKLASPRPEEEVAHVDYRSIEGKAQYTNQSADADLSLVSDSDENTYDQDLDLQARQVITMLSKSAKTDPTNIELWLALVEHQRRVLDPGNNDAILSSMRRKHLAELRLSILNEAAKHIRPAQYGRERLLFAMLEEGKVVWSEDKLSTKWREALVECPASSLLWTMYVDSIQDNHAGFRFEDCKAAYVSALSSLARNPTQPSSVSTAAVDHAEVHIFARLMHLYRDAGYNELAIASWQALLEYHFFMPTNLHTAAVDQRLISLEAFWESETPRIGEESAQGWASYALSEQPIFRASQHLSSTTEQAEQSFFAFARAEKRLSEQFILPSSADDEDAMADPYRCVMFADISEVLGYLDTVSNRSSILNAFLQYIGLPLVQPHTADVFAGRVSEDSHLWEAKLPSEAHEHFNGVESRQESNDTLFGTAFHVFRQTYKSPQDNELLVFIDRLLDLICIAADDENIAEYCLAYKLSLSPPDASKYAKRLLKRFPSSLRLYNAYAQILARTGSLDKATKVWSTAISMSKMLGENVQDDLVYLWHSRLLNQVNADEAGAALSDLLIDIASSSETGVASGASDLITHVSQLKATTILEEGFDRMQLTGKSVRAVAFVDTLAWLSYLTSSNDINKALQTYKKHCFRFKRDQSFRGLELLYQSMTALLRLHIDRRRPYRPATLYTALQEALQLFPNNSVIFEMHAHLAAQDRLRNLLQEQKAANSPSTAVGWILTLTNELRRAGSEFSGSTPNTIRATFSKALLLSESKVTHCPKLWQMWLHFELDVARRKGESLAKARLVFFDGMRCLPWHKDWAITGLNYLSNGGLTAHEMRQVYDSILERGLRVRVEVKMSV